jgi:hypothetical protein
MEDFENTLKGKIIMGIVFAILCIGYGAMCVLLGIR